jgi:hypothetical protein
MRYVELDELRRTVYVLRDCGDHTPGCSNYISPLEATSVALMSRGLDRILPNYFPFLWRVMLAKGWIASLALLRHGQHTRDFPAPQFVDN